MISLRPALVVSAFLPPAILPPTTVALAVPNYIASRDPAQPEPGKQYRLWLRTPGKACSQWRKVKPVLPREDMLLSEGKRDETGKEPGCKFTFVIQPATPPGAMRFELEPSVGAKEYFEVPAAAGSAQAHMPSTGLSGIANESGNGLAPTSAKGRLRMGDFAPQQGALKEPQNGSQKDAPGNQKHLDPGTGL